MSKNLKTRLLNAKKKRTSQLNSQSQSVKTLSVDENSNYEINNIKNEISR